MSISAYTGLPRSGKSFSVIEIMIEAVKEGREVYTNIPLHADVWLKELGAVPVVFDSQDIIDNPKWFDEILPVGALLALDECWRFWPAGLKASNVNPVHKEFLAMHGHKVNEAGITTQIILVTQDLAQLAAFVRQLIDKTFRCTKLDAIGQDKRFRVDIYQGAVTGQNPPLSQRLREIFYTYKPEIFKFYKSASQSKAGDVGNEKRIDDRANLLKGNTFKAIVAGMVLLPLIAMFLGTRVYNHYFKKADAVVSNTSTSAMHQPAPPPRLDGFLHKRSVIISANFSVNGAHYLTFKITDGDRVARLDMVQVLQLGYKIEPVSDCLVLLKGHGEEIAALCHDDDYKNPVVSAFTPDIPAAKSTL